MKIRVRLQNLLVILLVLVAFAPLNAVSAADFSQTIPPDPTEDVFVEVVNDYYAIIHTTTRDGTGLQADVINGPPAPPDRAAWEATQSSIYNLDRAANTLVNFPSYDWVFGCSAVSGAMIAGYYDNNGYPNMYTGSTNGGVMPQTDTSWDTWSDDYNVYPSNPLIASRDGVDGWSGRGSIEDYWVRYNSTADDPYIGSWTPHVPGTAIGDYMKTSQSAWPYQNVDGSTQFWNYNDSQKLTCSDMEILTYTDAGGTYNIGQNDGTYGRMQFYNARGYNVTDCYNQYIEELRPGGFSLSDFQAEIDAGHPVMINLEGHTVVGYGYNDDTIYIRDTWDSNPDHVYSMPWGGVYSDGTNNYQMLSVSIVHLEEPSSPPGTFGKSAPTNGALNQSLSPTLSWSISSWANRYEYCLDNCSEWISTGTSTSVQLTGLSANTIYDWQVRAVNDLGTTYANGSEGASWQFTTYDPAAFTEQNFIPLILN
ncbi:hypothetical protein KQH62_05475 [bacterium]|nr:hypothetical protein [bacterium]